MTASSSLREAVRRLRPPEPTAAVSRLRSLIVATALAVVVVEALNLAAADAPGWSLAVRTVWALLRVIGFGFLLRAVRFGRSSARPFGLILAVTTVFAVARLTAPRKGSLIPHAEVLVGFLVLGALCAAVVWTLYRSPGIADHLEHRPLRRHVPPSVLTARVAVLSYAPLVLVPLLVALGTIRGGQRPLLTTLGLLEIWVGLLLVLLVVVPVGALFLVIGHRWARWLLGSLSVLVLLLQPLLCYQLLGLDGALRDGLPLVVTAVLGLAALHGSRGVPTWVRPPDPASLDT